MLTPSNGPVERLEGIGPFPILVSLNRDVHIRSTFGWSMEHSNVKSPQGSGEVTRGASFDDDQADPSQNEHRSEEQAQGN